MMRETTAVRLIALTLMWIGVPVTAPASEARTVALVWDSAASASPSRSPAGQMIAPVLVRLGLTIRYVDLRQPLPDLLAERAVRGVVTFGDRNRMPDPAGYILWLERQVAAGKVFVCLGDPGIDYDDRGERTPAPLRARFWKLLGLADTGRWEQITYDHRIQKADAELIGFERKLGPELPPYRATVPARADLRSHLVIATPPKYGYPNPASHLVVTSPAGGYVALGYTHAEPAPGRRQWYVDPARFLQRALRLDEPSRGKS